ncbi:MAG: hypothetical protein RL460_486 [Actinomycetota bacterium]|jgi:uncharacterized membrane protein YhaH (DUF805 family)
MSFVDAIKSFFKNYATFTGRARRSEFWWTVLFTTLVSTGLSILFPGSVMELDGGITVRQNSAIVNLWSLVTLVPSLAITWRRLHDVSKSGPYFFFILLPIVGWILLLIQLVKDSTPGANTYGAPVK